MPGLRREEVALLAGVSLDYYTRLECGNIRGASESVLKAIADALHLNAVERGHLFDLAQASSSLGRDTGRRPTRPNVRSSVQRVLKALAVPAVPAIVYNTRQDLIGANLLGRALYAPQFDTNVQPNLARIVFLDLRAQRYY
ncbi:transcriptional regulator with XRE-family HTH domain [Paenarthrobacter nicotinovorans]|nr:transcriptional regulator with XRE-family HTH domain [Paenarthrobacter nicotinovorans]SCZ56661.1 Helix-turn-helix domain-containing protein [Arthrobacter sp. UNCCL28]